MYNPFTTISDRLLHKLKAQLINTQMGLTKIYQKRSRTLEEITKAKVIREYPIKLEMILNAFKCFETQKKRIFTFHER